MSMETGPYRSTETPRFPLWEHAHFCSDATNDGINATLLKITNDGWELVSTIRVEGGFSGGNGFPGYRYFCKRLK